MAGVGLVILLTLYLWTVIDSYAFYLEAHRNQISTNRYSSLRRALSLLVLGIQNNIINICQSALKAGNVLPTYWGKFDKQFSRSVDDNLKKYY